MKATHGFHSAAVGRSAARRPSQSTWCSLPVLAMLSMGPLLSCSMLLLPRRRTVAVALRLRLGVAWEVSFVHVHPAGAGAAVASKSIHIQPQITSKAPKSQTYPTTVYFEYDIEYVICIVYTR